MLYDRVFLTPANSTAHTNIRAIYKKDVLETAKGVTCTDEDALVSRYML